MIRHSHFNSPASRRALKAALPIPMLVLAVVFFLSPARGFERLPLGPDSADVKQALALFEETHQLLTGSGLRRQFWTTDGPVELSNAVENVERNRRHNGEEELIVRGKHITLRVIGGFVRMIHVHDHFQLPSDSPLRGTSGLSVGRAMDIAFSMLEQLPLPETIDKKEYQLASVTRPVGVGWWDVSWHRAIDGRIPQAESGGFDRYGVTFFPKLGFVGFSWSNHVIPPSELEPSIERIEAWRTAEGHALALQDCPYFAGMDFSSSNHFMGGIMDSRLVAFRPNHISQRTFGWHSDSVPLRSELCWEVAFALLRRSPPALGDMSQGFWSRPFPVLYVNAHTGAIEGGDLITSRGQGTRQIHALPLEEIPASPLPGDSQPKTQGGRFQTLPKEWLSQLKIPIPDSATDELLKWSQDPAGRRHARIQKDGTALHWRGNAAHYSQSIAFERKTDSALRGPELPPSKALELAKELAERSIPGMDWEEYRVHECLFSDEFNPTNTWRAYFRRYHGAVPFDNLIADADECLIVEFTENGQLVHLQYSREAIPPPPRSPVVSRRDAISTADKAAIAATTGNLSEFLGPNEGSFREVEDLRLVICRPSFLLPVDGQSTPPPDFTRSRYAWRVALVPAENEKPSISEVRPAIYVDAISGNVLGAAVAVQRFDPIHERYGWWD